jgi:Lamin Tail Domain/PKD domain
MRKNIVALSLLFFVFPAFARAAVVINEIAWMGTTANANAEWIELYNSDTAPVDITGWHLVAASGSPSITLAGTISANGYFLLERTSANTIPGVTADQVYSGALVNTGTTLTLTDANGNTVDQVIGGANWSNVGGDNVSKETAQRTASGWETAVATPDAINFGVSDTSLNSDNSSNTTTTFDDNASNSTSTTTTTTTTTNITSGPSESLPIPTLKIITSGDRTVSSNADTAFTATVYDNNGNLRNDAIVSWSFGDGMEKTGASVFHAYYDPGEYVAVVHASTSDGGDALAKITVTVEDANIKIVSVSARGITIANNCTRTLDVSLWRLSSGGQEFKIPENTEILAGHAILFPSQVIELPVSNSAELLYPSGDVAAAYPSENNVQLSSSAVSTNTVQAVDPIISTKKNIQENDEAVNAPAAATELAAAGAMMPSATSSANLGTTTVPVAGLMHSPWALGLLGTVVVAGGAFILL